MDDTQNHLVHGSSNNTLNDDLCRSRNSERTPDSDVFNDDKHLINILALSRQQLQDCLSNIQELSRNSRMRAEQLWGWIYRKGSTNFDTMTDISKDYRLALKKYFSINRPTIVSRHISKDYTRKYLLKTHDNHMFEMVYIPDDERGTLCVSSQIGCTLNCTFCHTGTQRLTRNLSVEEIVGQVMLCKDDLNCWKQNSEYTEYRLTNIVFMGMGEPLYNADSVRDAISIIVNNDGINLSRRKVTVSTAGVVPKIKQVGEEMKCMLAISLHATNDELRNKLIPINRKWNLASLRKACVEYPGISNSERITFEYIMLKNVNDSDNDAKALIKFLIGIPSKVNLIPFNSWDGAPYECSDPDRIEQFAKIINKAGYPSPIRTPRGQDIMAACGQLKSLFNK